METPADIAKAYFVALSRHDLDAAEGWWHDDIAEDFTPIGEFHGKAALRAYFAEMFAAAPDFALEVIRIVGDETTAVVQWRATGTFTGAPFQGILATGRAIEIRGVDVMQVRDGKVQANTIYYDGLTFARQIGLLPSEGSLPDRALMTGFNVRTRGLKLLKRG